MAKKFFLYDPPGLRFFDSEEELFDKVRDGDLFGTCQEMCPELRHNCHTCALDYLVGANTPHPRHRCRVIEEVLDGLMEVDAWIGDEFRSDSKDMPPKITLTPCPGYQPKG